MGNAHASAAEKFDADSKHQLPKPDGKPDEPVLLLKACIGNRRLGWDLLPPGSDRFEFEGKIYAGYKDVANFWDKGTEPKPVPWYAGRQYDADTAHEERQRITGRR